MQAVPTLPGDRPEASRGLGRMLDPGFLVPGCTPVLCRELPFPALGAIGLMAAFLLPIPTQFIRSLDRGRIVAQRLPREKTEPSGWPDGPQS